VVLKSGVGIKMGFCGGRFARIWRRKNAESEEESLLDKEREAEEGE